MDRKLNNWKLPKIPKRKVYRNGCLNLGVFSSLGSLGKTIPLNNRGIEIQLLNEADFPDIFEYKFDSKFITFESEHFLHVGLVQVGVKPLTRQLLNDSILVCLRDTRILDFSRSMMALVEFKLSDGPAYFNCFTNTMVQMADPNFSRSLTVTVMVKNRVQTTSDAKLFALSYRFCYKIMSTPSGDKALRESMLGETELFVLPGGSKSVVSRTIKWTDVDVSSYLQSEVQAQEKEGDK